MKELSQMGQALLASSLPRWKPKPLCPNLFGAMGSDAAFVLVKLGLMLAIVAVDDPDLLVGQAREPADDLVVGAAFLEVGDEIVDRDPAGGELEPATTIDQCDVFLHDQAPPPRF